VVVVAAAALLQPLMPPASLLVTNCFPQTTFQLTVGC